MRLLFIRHGDPDYSIDSLTEKGWKEAEYLAEKMEKINADYYYVSPMGRAKDTASVTLKKLNHTATEYPWLKEFRVTDPKLMISGDACMWDRMPKEWTKEKQFFQPDQWYLPDIVKESGLKQEYDWVVTNFDALLEKHGYQRDGAFYKVTNGNHDTLVFFCHFRVQCVLLSHLMNISPILLWHSLIAAPSSITTVATEEREKGIASFRVNSFGDISHLYKQGEPPSFAGRFRECYEDSEE